MQDIIKDLFGKARENSYFRQVLDTGSHTQVVIMNIPVGGDIGEETHSGLDQLIIILDGVGKVVLNGEEKPLQTGDAVLVKDGTKHNFLNTGSSDMKIITTYSPAHHPEGTIHKTKEEASKATY